MAAGKGICPYHCLKHGDVSSRLRNYGTDRNHGLLYAGSSYGGDLAGIFIGAGIGMVIKVGASTGGVDIPCLILRKKCGINVSLSLYVLDCVILGLQLITSGTEEVLYGIL